MIVQVCVYVPEPYDTFLGTGGCSVLFRYQDGEFYDYDKGERVGGKYPFYVKYTATSKWVSPIYGKDEEGHSVIINYEPEESKTDKETTETYGIDLMIKLRWD